MHSSSRRVKVWTKTTPKMMWKASNTVAQSHGLQQWTNRIFQGSPHYGPKVYCSQSISGHTTTYSLIIVSASFLQQQKSGNLIKITGVENVHYPFLKLIFN